MVAARLFHLLVPAQILVTSVTLSSVLVMVICYIPMTETSLKQARAVRPSIEMENRARFRDLGALVRPPTLSLEGKRNQTSKMSTN